MVHYEEKGYYEPLKEEMLSMLWDIIDTKNMSKNDIKDVVVGGIFSEEHSEETVHFSNKEELFYNKCQDEELIISELSKIANTYKRSSEVMNKYKN